MWAQRNEGSSENPQQSVWLRSEGRVSIGLLESIRCAKNHLAERSLIPGLCTMEVVRGGPWQKTRGRWLRAPHRVQGLDASGGVEQKTAGTSDINATLLSRSTLGSCIIINSSSLTPTLQTPTDGKPR